MMPDAEFLDHLWPVLGSAVAFTAWLIRLEGKANMAELNVEKLESKLEAFESNIFVKLSSIERSLARIQGRLSIGDESQQYRGE